MATLGPATAAAQPLNDHFVNARQVSAFPFTESLYVGNAGIESGEPTFFACDAQQVSLTKTVWYSFTPTVDTTVVVDTAGSTFDSVVAAHTGNFFSGTLTRVGCNNTYNTSAQARLTFTATAGQTYAIQIGDAGNSSGTLQVDFSVWPPNDDFSTATVVPATLPQQFSADSSRATTETGEPLNCSGFTFGKTLWYSLTPSATQEIIVEAQGTRFFILSVYTGTSVAALTQVACDAQEAPLSFTAVASTTYYVQIGSVVALVVRRRWARCPRP